MKMSGLMREDGTAETLSRDQILRRNAYREINIHFPCSADHVQDWLTTRLIHTLAICVTIHTYSAVMCNLINIHTYIPQLN